jgi:hypothetical protein
MSRRLGSVFTLLALASFALVTAEPSAAATGPINLLAGQSTDVGDVTVQSDGTRVRLLTRTAGACIAGLHAAVAGSPQLIPQTKRGNAIPGRFPVAREYTPCTTEAEVFVALSAIPGYVPGQPIYVALHADVVMPAGETDSAWAEGSGFPGANWSSYTDVALLPTVLTFDEVTLSDGAEQPIAAGYGGLGWDQVGLYNPNGVWGYAVKSESNLAFIAEASTFEVAGYPSPAGSPALIEGDMAFVGAWFSAAQRDDLAVTVSAYDDGVLVGRQVASVDRNGPTWVGFDDPNDGQRVESIDRLEMSADDGDPTTWDYFGLDDLTFFPGLS